MAVNDSSKNYCLFAADCFIRRDMSIGRLIISHSGLHCVYGNVQRSRCASVENLCLFFNLKWQIITKQKTQH